MHATRAFVFGRQFLVLSALLALISGCGEGGVSFDEVTATLEAKPAENSLEDWMARAGEVSQEESPRVVARIEDESSPVLLSELELNREIAFDEVAEIQFVAALDKWTGRIAWKRPRDSDHSYSTPLLFEHYDVPQIVSVGGRGVASYDPVTGQELWWCRHDGYSVVPRPVYGNGLVYICTGYNTPMLMAIDPSGSQDVTDTHVIWKAEKGVPFNPSPILVDSLLFLIGDTGVLSCYDALAGELLWQKRLRGRFSASPLLADGRLFLTSDEGVTYIVQPGEQFELVGQCELEGLVQASPAVSGRSLLVRTETHLYRIEENAGASSASQEVASTDWPQFRGPGGQGDAGTPGLPTSWNEETNVVWKAEIPGKGWSSPVVMGDRVWLTTAVEEESGAMQLQAVCVHRERGEIVSRTNLLRKLHPAEVHPRSSHATPTPVLDGDRVYVHFGAHMTACLSQEGELLWRNRLIYHHHHGPAGSPIVVGDLVVVNCDGYEGPYDPETFRERGDVEPE